MPNQIELKDAQQDQEIALLKHRVEQLEEDGNSKMVDELRERVRKLEKWVWGAAAVVSAAITIIGIAIAADAKPSHTTSSVIVEEINVREDSNAKIN